MRVLLYLQVPVHDAHGVQVVDRIQNLPNEPTGVHLCVETLLHNPIKEFTSGHPDMRQVKMLRIRGLPLWHTGEEKKSGNK